MAGKERLAGIFVVIFMLSVFVFCGTSFAQQESEEVMQIFAEEQTIVTASKREQKISEAPAAVAVITSEDIRQSGATQFSEALSMVPGLHLGYAGTSNIVAVGGIRGFHSPLLHQIILLIDGKPYNFEIYQSPQFSPFPLALEEIERIEVVRGAGSALYGPNAMFGIVNVITKPIKNTQGSLVSITAGEYSTLVSDYIYSNSIDKLDYRLSLGYSNRDNWDKYPWLDDPMEQCYRFNTKMDYQLDDNSMLNLTGTYLDAPKEKAYINVVGVSFDDSVNYEFSATYTSKAPNLILRTYYSKKDTWDSGFTQRGAAFPFAWVQYFNFMSSTKLLEIQQTLEPFANDSLLWGANYTKLEVKAPVVQGRRRHDNNGVFVDNTYKFKDNLSLNTSLRMDHHPNAGDALSHRLAILSTPLENQHLRLSWGSSFRYPDFSESYTAYGPLIPSPLDPILLGREDLKPERAETYELGYIGLLGKKLSLDASLFYTKLTDSIAITPTVFIIVPPGIPVPVQYEFLNSGDSRQFGSEIELRYPFTKWLNGIINYTYTEQWEKDDDAIVRAMIVQGTPQHMGNVELRAKANNGLSTDLSVHYRGPADFMVSPVVPIDDEGNISVSGGHLKQRTWVNLRLGYDCKLANNDAEVALQIFNLFDQKYPDYPLTNYDIHRRITAKFTYKF